MTSAAALLPNRESVTRLVPGGAASLAQLTDDELLASTGRLVGKSNQLLAALLLHLAEVEARGVHRTRSCASLYTYCIYELRFSEDAAARRSAAARFVKQFPALLDAVAEGELHLTGLLMIGPHLTPENHAEVLGRARFRTKKELAKLVRELNPLPGVPDLVQPLGPEAARACRNPTWAEFVESLCPSVRKLPAGARPSDWANEGMRGAMGERTDGASTVEDEGLVGGALGGRTPEGRTLDGEVCDGEVCDGGVCDGGVCDGEAADAELPVGPVPADLPPVTSPQRYQLQFETVEEHVQLLERAKALLARERPGVSLGELHLEAMKLLVASLEKRKFAVGVRPRQPRQRRSDAERAPSVQRDDDEKSNPPRRRVAAERVALVRRDDDEKSNPPRQRVAAERVALVRRDDAENRTQPRQRVAAERVASVRRDDDEKSNPPRRRVGAESSRHIPAAMQREVYQRDAGRCSYVDLRGQRCCETRYLELHHLEPFAKGGAHATSNLALRCAAHNRLAAEQDFGQSSVIARRDAPRHESLARQLAHDGGDCQNSHAGTRM